MTDISFLKESLNEFNINCTDEMTDRFVRFHSLICEWNSFMNLTAITEWNDVVTKHFADSLSLCRCVDDMTDMSYSLLDIGTGAGFPGIPLKIAFPKLDITLMDSLNKRVIFLNEVIKDLGLTGIRAIHSRAESLGHNSDYREKFDIVVSRAVANMTVLSELCLPYVRTGGRFICYKTDNCDDEVREAAKAIDILGGKMDSSIEFRLPLSDISRRLYVINKVKDTPQKYPRKEGTPSRSPLC